VVVSDKDVVHENVGVELTVGDRVNVDVQVNVGEGEKVGEMLSDGVRDCVTDRVLENVCV
jgi:hypothetical protein